MNKPGRNIQKQCNSNLSCVVWYKSTKIAAAVSCRNKETVEGFLDGTFIPLSQAKPWDIHPLIPSKGLLKSAPAKLPCPLMPPHYTHHPPYACAPPLIFSLPGRLLWHQWDSTELPADSAYSLGAANMPYGMFVIPNVGSGLQHWHCGPIESGSKVYLNTSHGPWVCI